MGVFVVMMLFFVGYALVKGLAGSQNNYKRLFTNGTPARGILLSVSSMSLGSVGVGLYKFQQYALCAPNSRADRARRAVSAAPGTKRLRRVLPRTRIMHGHRCATDVERLAA